MRRTREQCSYKKVIGLLIILVSQGFIFPIFSQNSIPDSVRIKAVPLTMINTKDGEYSPFKYDDKFYFVSDRENDFGVVYYDQSSSHQFSDLYKATVIDTLKFKNPVPISNQLKTKFYIGPSCETKEGFYCTVNNSGLIKSKRKLPLQISFLKKDEKNKLLKPERISFGLNDTISCAQPSVWGDTLMFFASDLFGETGKIDLFYSIKKDNVWQRPVSCGSKVNTEYNEVFPFFINNTLYFSSDRPNGMGGLDIYQVNLFEENAKATLLSNPINSSKDDFGVYIDSLLTSGYFSSNRSGNDDIYYFNTVVPSFNNCTEVKSNNYCFTFYEEASLDTQDTTGMTYEWSFGDGSKRRGLEVSHCYAGEGKFLVELNVVDKTTGAIFSNEVSYEFEIKNIIQIYIHAPDTAKTGTDILFDPSYTNIDSLEVKKYYWDFGDGAYSFEEKPAHAYLKEGEYLVKLGLDGTRNNKKYKECATKKIVISDKVETPIFSFVPPIKNDPPINYAQRIKDSIAIHEKEFYDFIVKKEREDSIANIKKLYTVEIKKEDESKVGIFPVIEKDDKYKNISNVYSFNEKDSTVTYKVHIGVSEDKIDPKDPAFKGLDQISSVLMDSLYHYFYGETKNKSDIIPYYEKSKEEGFNSSIISSFKKDTMIQNPNLRHQFTMIKDTIHKGEVRPDNKVVVKNNVTNPNTTKEPIKPKDPVEKTDPKPEVKTTNAPSGNRVEIVSSKTKRPKEEFKKFGSVTEVLGDDGYYTYFTDDVKTPENAKDLKAVLVELGYTNAKVVGEKPTVDTKKPFKNDPFINAGGPIAYRVQIGAYKTPKPKNSFDALKGAVREFKTDDGYYKYVTEDVKTLENALDLQSALLSMGYRNSFVTAYEGNRRIPLIESILAGLSVYFNLDSYKVLPSEMEKIDFYFKKYANKAIKEVELEGNTCNLGTADYNFKLSENRVLAVEKVLEPYVKVKINRKFLGEFYPLHKNNPESVRRLNRRVDVILLE
jgi:outer membrane protein OmpA-like peptidoglycan-associated protein